ncbi:hypothetical protein BDV95DRAFT_623800 [Massariosphaeria phaeospora]|uniref:Uncharacterized protein n=1 Tax=Massariosphaeria phaeospora TaxID=100035 RepID=A0A7C8HYV2_9PLEO|nr:hypothetical protein BDV95DRAFT_623800 [Massariosphaeria phaeospora]
MRARFFSNKIDRTRLYVPDKTTQPEFWECDEHNRAVPQRFSKHTQTRCYTPFPGLKKKFTQQRNQRFDENGRYFTKILWALAYDSSPTLYSNLLPNTEPSPKSLFSTLHDLSFGQTFYMKSPWSTLEELWLQHIKERTGNLKTRASKCHAPALVLDPKYG